MGQSLIKCLACSIRKIADEIGTGLVCLACHEKKKKEYFEELLAEANREDIRWEEENYL